MDEKIIKKKEFAPYDANSARSLGCKLFSFMIFLSMRGAGVQFEYKILTLAA
jgi:hypothetical protein